MSHALTLAFKDLRLLVRDKPGLFFTCFFPIVFAIFFGAVFSGMGGDSARIDVIVVDEDGTAGSAAFVDRLRAAAELSVRTTAGDPPTPMTAAQAEERVRLGRTTALVVVPKGFGAPGRSMFWDGSRRLELGVDPARKAEAGLLEGILTRYMFEQMNTALSDAGAALSEVEDSRGQLESREDIDPQRRALLDSMFEGIARVMTDLRDRPVGTEDGASPSAAAAFNPVRIERREIAVQRRGPRNAFALSFAQGLMWGICGCAASFGISMVVERTRGTLVRLRASPLAWWQILAGKGLACFIASLAVAGALMLIARFAFGVRPDSAGLLVLALVCLAFCFVGLMMLLSVVGKTENAAGAIGWAVIIVLMMFGGGMVPTFVMPSWMQSLSRISPVYWGIRAVEGALWRGFSLGEMLLPCGVLVAFGAATLLLGIRLFRVSERG